MNEKTVTQLLAERQELFIATRTNIENEVNKFLTSLENLDEDVKSQCQIKGDVTAKELLPALWEKPFDEVKYQQQLAAFNVYVQSIMAFCDKINEEALRCLQS